MSNDPKVFAHAAFMLIEDINIICLSQATLCLKGYIRLQKVTRSSF